MFSGLTNQVTSWMGNVKGDTEEKVPTPTEDANNLLQNEPFKVPEGVSPTKQTEGSKLEMFSNVKNQIEGIGGWLGSSIPKLRKGQSEAGNPEATGVENPAADVISPVTGDPAVSVPRDDDDNSRPYSATGGADSGPASVNDSPTDENKDGQFGNVQSKALAGAKTLGSFLYSAVNKAGKTVSEASAKIKETVEKNNILGEFSKEQDAFMKGKANNTSANLPPWAGCPNEESLKEECLSLSTDRRNFVRAPPAGVDFVFDYEMKYPVAMAIMEQDPNLEKMRYELVPKIISEEEFWRNYFYRVSLICQANEVSSREGNIGVTDTIDKTDMVHEFVSDMLKVNEEDLNEVQESLKKLGVEPKSLTEEEWEKELEAELNDYELVADQKSASASSKTNWEDEAADLLGDDGTDLK